MTAANTGECFEEFIGQELRGVLFDALPVNRRDIASGTKTLVFADGRGLTLASNGSFWIDGAEEVGRAIRAAERQLANTRQRLEGVLSLAGEKEKAT